MQNLNIEKEKDREKEKVGGRPAKVIEKKGWQRSRARVENKGDIFCWENTMKTLKRWWEMINASGHHERWKWAAVKKKKKNDKTYDIPCIKLVTKKFLEVSRCSRGKQRQRDVQKKGAARAKFLFC